MKLSKLFFGFAAAAMFAACSSDDIVQEQNQIKWNEDGTGYMAFNLTMPQQTGTRANDVFDDGEEAEYNVKDATLLLFNGDKFHSAYVLDGTHDFGTGTNVNITGDNKYVFKVDSEGSLENPRAFVVLNSNGIFKVEDKNININGTLFTNANTFADIQGLMNKVDLDLQASAFHTNADEFLMMNAPLFDKKGGAVSEGGDLSGGKVSVLAVVDKDAIKSTKEEAEKAPAVSIYVERAVAKVTVKAETVATPTTFDVKLNGWTLDNTNKSSYLVRSTADFADNNCWAISTLDEDSKAVNYRMVGHTSVAHKKKVQDGQADAPETNEGITNGYRDDTDLYRTYFAKDTNYDGVFDKAQFTTKAADKYASEITTEFGKDMYCAENTFNLANMNYKNTTRVLLSAEIIPDGETDPVSFYGIPGDDKIATNEAVMNAAQSYAVRLVQNLETGDYLTTATPSYAKEISTSDPTKVKVTITGVTAKAWSDLTEAQKADVLSTKDAESTLTDEEYYNQVFLAILNNSGHEFYVGEFGYGYYKNGVAYYDTRIKHFGDDLTPWDLPHATNTTDAYSTDVAAYLGRWGVLRNNWYELKVTAVNKLGFADPSDLILDDDNNPFNPGYGDTPDDNKESEMWISVDVNILSWAKRTQNVEL